MTFYTENTKYTEDEIEENIQTDWYIRMDEAIEKGLVDEVITDIDVLC
jgi:ATP-dependent protease ClpP protease subunit